MRIRSPLHAVVASVFLIAVTSALPGCGSGKQTVVEDEHPITNFGVGATILMPGQTAPMPGERGVPGGAYGPTTGNVSFIGGTALDQKGERSHNQNLGGSTVGKAVKDKPGQAGRSRQASGSSGSGDTPLWIKVIAAPFVVLSYPFVKLAEVIGHSGSVSQSGSASTSGTSGGPNAGSGTVSSSQSGGSAPSAGTPVGSARAIDPGAAREAAQLDAMERELAGMGEATPPAAPPAPTRAPAALPGAPVAAAAATPPPPAPIGRAPSIAEELARLQATIAPRPRAQDVAAATRADAPPAASAPSVGLADLVRDRNGDGRPDQWSYHDADGRPTRELLDEDGDGAPDRTVWFDPTSGKEQRVEEDTNLDGRIDSWVEYRGGVMARQRRDSDHDGFLDTWSFYDAGGLARQEQDLNGDGFRNRVAFYEAGRIVREREDRDGDGQVDRITVYDDAEQILRRDEDTDGDGRVDLRSVYEQGKLVRREMVDAEAADQTEQLEAPEWHSDARAPEWSEGHADASGVR